MKHINTLLIGCRPQQWHWILLTEDPKDFGFCMSHTYKINIKNKNTLFQTSHLLLITDNNWDLSQTAPKIYTLSQFKHNLHKWYNSFNIIIIYINMWLETNVSRIHCVCVILALWNVFEHPSWSIFYFA